MDNFKPSKMWELRYALKLARANEKRARTRHNNEQTKGESDRSVKQTRRMYLACQNLQRASFKSRDALHNLRIYQASLGDDAPVAKELLE